MVGVVVVVLVVVVLIYYYSSNEDSDNNRNLSLTNNNGGEDCVDDKKPFLEEDPLRTVPPLARYIPLSENEKLASIYTWWNILDRIMEKSYLIKNPVGSSSDSSSTTSTTNTQLNTGPKWMYGYIRDYQMKIYTESVHRLNKRNSISGSGSSSGSDGNDNNSSSGSSGSSGKRYCEIGVNGGHGTIAMLLSDPLLDVVSFDLGEYR